MGGGGRGGHSNNWCTMILYMYMYVHTCVYTVYVLYTLSMCNYIHVQCTLFLVCLVARNSMIGHDNGAGASAITPLLYVQCTCIYIACMMSFQEFIEHPIIGLGGNAAEVVLIVCVCVLFVLCHATRPLEVIYQV